MAMLFALGTLLALCTMCTVHRWRRRRKASPLSVELHQQQLAQAAYMGCSAAEDGRAGWVVETAEDSDGDSRVAMSATGWASQLRVGAGCKLSMWEQIGASGEDVSDYGEAESTEIDVDAGERKKQSGKGREGRTKRGEQDRKVEKEREREQEKERKREKEKEKEKAKSRSKSGRMDQAKEKASEQKERKERRKKNGG
eukprot:392473-Prymnesium_polylepis.1